jgi:glycosyltransferase involved in cell wall biosynthesis
MKVITNCHVPFMLTHGGGQIQIHQTQVALAKAGLDVEPLRWWDETQTGDVLMNFGGYPTELVRFAHHKGMKVVVSLLLTEQGSRSRARLKVQSLTRRLMIRVLPSRSLAPFNWDSFSVIDAAVVLTHWEAFLAQELYGTPPEKIHIVPNGVEDLFLNSQPASRGPWLVCTATITERKRVLELAEAAVRAQTPLWIIGKPYAESDPYAQKFAALARANPRFVRYEGPIQDRTKLVQVYREARGFVLLSAMESLSLSALEAAACECPLLLSQLPWATTVFGKNACYCPVSSSTDKTAASLRRFYDAAPGLKPPAQPLSWLEVGQQLKQLYESLLVPSAA